MLVVERPEWCQFRVLHGPSSLALFNFRGIFYRRGAQFLITRAVSAKPAFLSAVCRGLKHAKAIVEERKNVLCTICGQASPEN